MQLHKSLNLGSLSLLNLILFLFLANLVVFWVYKKVQAKSKMSRACSSFQKAWFFKPSFSKHVAHEPNFKPSLGSTHLYELGHEFMCLVSCQKNRSLIDRSANHSPVFWHETTWTNVQTLISEKTDFSLVLTHLSKSL